MALRDFLTFDQLPNLASTGGIGATPAIAAIMEYPTCYANAEANWAGERSLYTAMAITAQYWLNLWPALWNLGSGNFGNALLPIQFPYASLSNYSDPQSYIGFRYQYSIGNLNTASGVSVSTTVVASPPAPAGQDVTGTPLSSACWLSNGTTTVNLAPIIYIPANTPVYVEILIDRQNNAITMWVDGTALYTTSFNFTTFASGKTLTLFMGGLAVGTYTTTAYTGMLCQLRDVYFVDNTQDSTLCTRLGSVTANPAVLASATGPNWGSSDGNGVLADLNAAITTTTATQTAPIITSPASMNPLTLGLNTSGLNAVDPILAAKLDVSAARVPGAAFSFLASASYNGDTTTPKQLSLAGSTTGNFLYNQAALLMEKAPDGTIWTPTSLAAAEIILQPETA